MRHLFIDDAELTRVDRLHRHVHQPQKQGDGPVLTADTPWERSVSIYGTTLYDEERQLFRRWYLTSPGDNLNRIEIRGQALPGNVTLLGYATSKDGITWDKPDLGQVSIDGDTHNNIVDIGRLNCEGAGILYDPQESDPNQRYKTMYWEHGGEGTLTKLPEGRVLFGSGEGDGMWISHSPDGERWTNYERNPAIGLGSDTDHTLLWVPSIHKYVAYGRFGAGGRKVARSVSGDFVRWSEPQLVFECDDGDECETQFYSMPVDLYEGVYIGMPWVYRAGVDGTIDTQLAVSRDGIGWQRVGTRQTFLPLGEPGTWDDGMARIGKRFIVRDDQIYLFFGGVHGPHVGRKFSGKHSVGGGVGLALLRRDGFVSMHGSANGGTLLTRPVTVSGDTLHLNVDASNGRAEVALFDQDGQPIERWRDATPVTGDQLDATVTWQDATLAKLRGEKLRLQIRLTNADIFSFWFE